ncbi:MAG TPA: hypothetical protein VFQ61_04070 [Polyangiaceae bacterium]|nr:hypothetical protein [Polyangiaceae bacterium]
MLQSSSAAGAPVGWAALLISVGCSREPHLDVETPTGGATQECPLVSAGPCAGRAASGGSTASSGFSGGGALGGGASDTTRGGAQPSGGATESGTSVTHGGAGSAGAPVGGRSTQLEGSPSAGSAGASASSSSGGASPPDALIRGDAPTPQSTLAPGPYAVATLTSGLRDGPAYGSQTLHYPTDTGAPFAGVVVVPGFVSPESSMRAWGPFLASHGIVTLTIGTNSGGDPPEMRAKALLDGIETLKAENERSTSPIQGKLATNRFAVMGWSMGGGGTLIAANGNPTLKAAIGLAAWSPGQQFTEDQVPTLLLAGSADVLAGGQSQGFYSSIPNSTPKMLFEVAGGDHSIANDPSSARGEIGRYGLSWLKVFLEGDLRYREFLRVKPTQSSDFRANIE